MATAASLDDRGPASSPITTNICSSVLTSLRSGSRLRPGAVSTPPISLDPPVSPSRATPAFTSPPPWLSLPDELPWRADAMQTKLKAEDGEATLNLTWSRAVAPAPSDLPLRRMHGRPPEEARPPPPANRELVLLAHVPASPRQRASAETEIRLTIPMASPCICGGTTRKVLHSPSRLAKNKIHRIPHLEIPFHHRSRLVKSWSNHVNSVRRGGLTKNLREDQNSIWFLPFEWLPNQILASTTGDGRVSRRGAAGSTYP